MDLALLSSTSAFLETPSEETESTPPPAHPPIEDGATWDAIFEEVE